MSRQITTESGEQYRLVIARRVNPPAVLESGHRGIMLRLLIAAAISAIVSFILARYLSRPLGDLGRASRRLARGDLATRIGAPLTARKDEFGGLALDIDHMAEKLQELQRANRRLLRDVSHELRSPLARLGVALEIARNRDCEPVENELNRIELEAQRLEELIEEVLGLLRESSETRPLTTESFSLNEFIMELIATVNYEVPEGSPGVVMRPADDCMIEANRELLWRALENLSRNALVHTGRDQPVELSLKTGNGNTVEVVVSDRGTGLADEHLERIFEPFYRAQEARDRNTGGHGLGLAIAAAAIRRHGGSIRAANREGGGLEMCITLPLNQRASRQGS